MFRTTATLAQLHPSRSWMTGRAPVVFSLALAVVLPVSALLATVSPLASSLVPVALMLGGGLYSTALSRSLRPVRRRIDLVIDPRGLFADGVRLAARGAVLDAYLRPATEAIRSPHFFYPAQPKRVEVVTAQETILLEGESETHLRHILAALGVPARVVSVTYQAPTAENARLAHGVAWSRRWQIVFLVLMAVVPIGLGLTWVAWSYLHRPPPSVYGAPVTPALSSRAGRGSGAGAR